MSGWRTWGASVDGWVTGSNLAPSYEPVIAIPLQAKTSSE